MYEKVLSELALLRSVSEEWVEAFKYDEAELVKLYRSVIAKRDGSSGKALLTKTKIENDSLNRSGLKVDYEQ